jgi:predicted GNAT family acetyltransferase
MPVTDLDDDVSVVRNDTTHRYEIHARGVLAGYTMFRFDADGRLHFPHTEIDPAFRGQGLAPKLVAGAMADVARRGETVVPHCPVVAGWLRKNEVPGLTIEWPAIPRPE